MTDSLPATAQGIRLSHLARQWGDVLMVSERWQHRPVPVVHAFPTSPQILLVSALDSRGGIPQPRLSPGRRLATEQGRRAINMVSPGMSLWGYSDTVTYVQDACLQFSARTAEAILGDNFDPRRVELPLLCHHDDRLFAILRLLADAIEHGDAASGPYGEGLICAAMSLLFARREKTVERSHGLARWQVERVTELIKDRLPERVSIAEMAQVAGLSPAYFSRAFKKTTGKAPYQWQLHARVEHSFEQLRRGELPLDAVAEEAGFADASHYARVFRRHVGVAPGQWRRQFGRRIG